MREHYDFKSMKGQKNPYVKELKRPITIRLEQPTIAYFKAMAEEVDLPYQNIINRYLRDCAASGRKLHINWRP